MMCRIGLIAATLACLGATAHAAEYRIKLDGYCDRLKFHLDRGRLWGVSDGRQRGAPCDDSILTGTVAATTAPVTPTGSIVTASGDLGAHPAQFVNYLDLANHTFTLYGTADGKTIARFAGTWSPVTEDDAEADDSALPPVTSVLSQRATHTEPTR